jgi:hypothetical protein
MWLKQLFCIHNWKFWMTGVDEEKGAEWEIYKCTKCGKVRDII